MPKLSDEQMRTLAQLTRDGITVALVGLAELADEMESFSAPGSPQKRDYKTFARKIRALVEWAEPL